MEAETAERENPFEDIGGKYKGKSARQIAIYLSKALDKLTGLIVEK